MMEDILIISNYYPPEKGAAANRIEQLAIKLRQNHYKVTVLCPLGNYPKGELFPEYKGKFRVTELRDGITVKRLWIYPSVSKKILVRLLSVLSFSLCLFAFLLFKKTPKKVVVQSPPLLLSFISVLVLSLKRKKIILNISDLWPLAAVELKAVKEQSFSHRVSLLLERYLYKKAAVILGQSNEIITHVKSRFPEKSCFLYRNFPEHQSEKMTLLSLGDEPVRLFYAGLLGVAQGILELCEKIDLSPPNIELHVFGDGAEKAQLEALISSGKTTNIYFHGMVDRHQLHDRLQAMDVAIVPLKTRIYGSVPSKIFEFGAMGFPILYFGGGEGEKLVLENEMGWVAPVADYNAFNEIVREIAQTEKTTLHLMKKRIYDHAKLNFNLDRQVKDLISKKVF